MGGVYCYIFYLHCRGCRRGSNDRLCRGSECLISCSNSSLLECPPEVQEVVGSNPGLNMSVLSALVDDGDGLGRVSP